MSYFTKALVNLYRTYRILQALVFLYSIPSTFSHCAVHRKGCGNSFPTGVRTDEQIIILTFHRNSISSLSKPMPESGGLRVVVASILTSARAGAYCKSYLGHITMMDGINKNTKTGNQAWRKKPSKFAPKSRLGCKTCKYALTLCIAT